jgi:hypothetical protein
MNMATTIDASAIFSGAPVSLTVGGTECGATISVPKFEIEVESGSPQFTNAGGPVKGTRINRRAIPSLTVDINEINATKIGWAMPGSSGGAWTLSRLEDAAYQEVVVTSQPSSGGDVLTLTLHNCTSAESQSLDFDDDPAKPMTLTLKFTAHYDQATPKLVPFDWAIA